MKREALDPMPEKFIYRGSMGARAVGIEPGSFVRIHQGYSRSDNIILHYTDIKKREGDECFVEFDHEPETMWGSGVYLVRKDGTLLEIKNDWDTSD